MRKIRISDITLDRMGEEASGAFGFKEKLEIARQLENLNADVIELPRIVNPDSDTLLIRTVGAFVKNSILSVNAGSDIVGIEAAAASLAGFKNRRIKLDVPVSPVNMEYSCHKKAPAMLNMITELVKAAKQCCDDVELCALDATRAEADFLNSAIDAAVSAGATVITLCDDDATMLPDTFAAFVSGISARLPEDGSVLLGVRCDDKMGMATALAVMAVRAGANEIKASAGKTGAPNIDLIGQIIRDCGDKFGICSGVKYTQLSRTVKQVRWIAEGSRNDSDTGMTYAANEGGELCASDTADTVKAAVTRLGYDLSDEDYKRVDEEFRRVAAKKSVGMNELDAIVASVALQAPPAYELVSYTINSSNLTSATAHIVLQKNGESHEAVTVGDGSLDAAFTALEQIAGCHYELDGFRILALTEGREAVGSTLVRLRRNGKLYSGKGISTDIIGASIRAYINAINKIVYVEA